MRPTVLCIISALVFSAIAQNTPPSQLPLNDIQLPPGFQISLYSQQNVPSARQLALSDGANSSFPDAVVVYVGSTGAVVSALVDRDGTGQNVTVVPLLQGLNGPNGVAWYNGSLYVAEIRRITRYDDADSYALAGQPLPNGTVVAQNWNPDQDDHQYHYISVGPDEQLYVPQGSPSNTGPCQSFQNITECAMNRMSLDGTNQMTVATGIRNSVGYDWDDEGNLWATSNGRDNLDPDHDDRPDDVLVYIPMGSIGLDFGFPFCHWEGLGSPYDRLPGPGIINLDDVNVPVGVNNQVQFMDYCEEPANNDPPSQALGPHVAALGMQFYRGSMFPEEYYNTIFIAQHGSWDREPPIGYRVMQAIVDTNGTTTGYSIFAQGWLQNANSSNPLVWGRPVDVLTLRDGSLLVSDDASGVVYRISYSADSSAPVAASSLAG